MVQAAGGDEKSGRPEPAIRGAVGVRRVPAIPDLPGAVERFCGVPWPLARYSGGRVAVVIGAAARKIGTVKFRGVRLRPSRTLPVIYWL